MFNRKVAIGQEMKMIELSRAGLPENELCKLILTVFDQILQETHLTIKDCFFINTKQSRERREILEINRIFYNPTFIYYLLSIIQR
jgi:hypothetical protein